MEFEICPQCGQESTNLSLRLVQESCGHKKCRKCLLIEEEGCRLCFKDKSTKIFDNTTNVICYSLKVKSEDQQNETKENLHKNNRLVENLSGHIKKIQNESKNFKESKKKVRLAKEKIFKCEHCELTFFRKSNLLWHENKHKVKTEYSCDKCRASFVTNSRLKRHLKIHLDERLFKCKDCEKSFITKDALTCHSRIHLKNKSFRCTKCSKVFPNKSNLSHHMITHSNDAKFQCGLCERRFKSKQLLKLHQKTHSKERPFICSECPRAFKNSHDMNRHKIIHSDINPFSCNICAIKFRRKDNLIRHLRNIHPERNENGVKEKLDKNKVVISKDNNNNDEKSFKKIEENNSINVIVTQPSVITSIKKLNEENLKNTEKITQPNAVSVINGPLKLAFKTNEFKNNYNIKHNTDVNKFFTKTDHVNKFSTKTDHGNIYKQILSNDNSIEESCLKNVNNVQQVQNNFLEKSLTDDNQFNDNVKIYKKILSNDDNSLDSRNRQEKSCCLKIEENFSNKTNENCDNVNKFVDNVNIYKKILSTDSLENCSKNLNDPQAIIKTLKNNCLALNMKPLHYETSFENSKDAIIKNIKFKLPPDYTAKISKFNSFTNNNFLKNGFSQNLSTNENSVSFDSKNNLGAQKDLENDLKRHNNYEKSNLENNFQKLNRFGDDHFLDQRKNYLDVKIIKDKLIHIKSCENEDIIKIKDNCQRFNDQMNDNDLLNVSRRFVEASKINFKDDRANFEIDRERKENNFEKLNDLKINETNSRSYFVDNISKKVFNLDYNKQNSIVDSNLGLIEKSKESSFQISNLKNGFEENELDRNIILKSYFVNNVSKNILDSEKLNRNFDVGGGLNNLDTIERYKKILNLECRENGDDRLREDREICDTTSLKFDARSNDFERYSENDISTIRKISDQESKEPKLHWRRRMSQFLTKN